MLKKFFVSIFLVSLSLTAIANPPVFCEPDHEVEQQTYFGVSLPGGGGDGTFYCNASNGLHDINFYATGLLIEGFYPENAPKSYTFADASIVNKVYFKAYQDPTHPGNYGQVDVQFYGCYTVQRDDLVCFPGTGGRSIAFGASH